MMTNYDVDYDNEDNDDNDDDNDDDDIDDVDEYNEYNDVNDDDDDSNNNHDSNTIQRTITIMIVKMMRLIRRYYYGLSPFLYKSPNHSHSS